MMMNNRRFYNFPRITVAVYFTEFESIIVYRGTRRARCLSEKACHGNFGPPKILVPGPKLSAKLVRADNFFLKKMVPL